MADGAGPALLVGLAEVQLVREGRYAGVAKGHRDGRLARADHKGRRAHVGHHDGDGGGGAGEGLLAQLVGLILHETKTLAKSKSYALVVAVKSNCSAGPGPAATDAE